MPSHILMKPVCTADCAEANHCRGSMVKCEVCGDHKYECQMNSADFADHDVCMACSDRVVECRVCHALIIDPDDGQTVCEDCMAEGEE